MRALVWAALVGAGAFITTRVIRTRQREVGKLRRDTRDSIGWLKTADDLLTALHRSREGAGFSKLLAMASIGGTLLDKLVPAQGTIEELREQGYEPLRAGLGTFFINLIKGSISPTRSVPVEEGSQLYYWGEKEEIAGVFSSNGHMGHPMLFKGETETFKKLVQQVAWASGTDLMLSFKGDDNEIGSSSYELLTMEAPGQYFGDPQVDWYARRLKRHNGDTRSMLLAGPSGAGKSTLGRLIAKAVDGGKTLKVSSKALRRCSASDLVDLVTFLEPSVLLLDDLMALKSHSSDEQMLELLEALHGKARLIIATLMDDSSSDDTTRNYFSGMRPGRIDEVVRVRRPPPRIRREILVSYLGGPEAVKKLRITDRIMTDIVRRCHGLTGAYLKEVAHRLITHGVSSYRREVFSVVSAAPPCPEKGAQMDHTARHIGEAKDEAKKKPRRYREKADASSPVTGYSKDEKKKLNKLNYD